MACASGWPGSGDRCKDGRDRAARWPLAEPPAGTPSCRRCEDDSARMTATFKLGSLVSGPAALRPDLLALTTQAALARADLLDDVGVVEIDPAVSGTATTQ